MGKRKRHSSGKPIPDPLLLSRLNKYLEARQSEETIDQLRLVEDLRTEYKEYEKRDKVAFSASVFRAYNYLIQPLVNPSSRSKTDEPNSGSGSEESLDSSEEDEVVVEDEEDTTQKKKVMKTNGAISYLQSIHKMVNTGAFSGEGDRHPSVEVCDPIDISSEDEIQEPSRERLVLLTSPKEKSSSAKVFLDRRPLGSNRSRIPSAVSIKAVKAPYMPANVGTPKKSNYNRSLPMSSSSKTMLGLNILIPYTKFKDFAGHDKLLGRLRILLQHVSNKAGAYRRLGVVPPRGLLLHGPPGTGKTLLASCIAGELGVPLVKVAGPELISGISGESEARVRELFDEACACAPCVLFIDEIDAVSGPRESASKDMERRVVAQLLCSIDELSINEDWDQVVLVGATSRPESLDAGLRRAGRFDTELALGMPDREARLALLKVVGFALNLADDVSLDDLAAKTPGYVAADLKALVNHAAIQAISRWSQEEVDAEDESFSQLSIRKEDFSLALGEIQPSSKREGFATVPDVSWDDIGSLKDVRDQLQSSILLPTKYPEEYKRLGIPSSGGVMLCGPPGCGKTLLAKAVANEANINFISVKGPELLNMYLGESERAVRQCFQRARNSQPCVIFFDEIDALCPKRSSDGHSEAGWRVVNQLLTELDGVEGGRTGVFVMAATNRPDSVDPALLRPGRLDRTLFVGLPSPGDRADILRAITKGGKAPPLAEDVDLEALGKNESLDGYSGADLSALVKEAALAALREHVAAEDRNLEALVVKSEHFKMAVSTIRPSVSPEDQVRYEMFKNMFTSVKSSEENSEKKSPDP